MRKKIKPGGINSSIFALMVLCLGAGTVSIPYVFYENGIIFGIVLLSIGALLSIYTGWLIAVCSHNLNASRYEDIAIAVYGRKVSYITSFCMLSCMIGFSVSLIVLVSQLRI